MKNLVIVGTSHIAKQSVEDVTAAINSHMPAIVALELDHGRLENLLHPARQRMSFRDVFKVGVKGWLFAQLGAWAERALGKHVGASPGQEMLAAVKLARKQRIPIALIDQNIVTTLKRFSRKITWTEKARFVFDILKAALFRRRFEFDLRTVPSKKLVEKLTEQLRLRYPNIYRVLVAERNQVMALNLARIMQHHPDKKIVAVVGAGHEEELINLVEKRLRQIT